MSDRPDYRAHLQARLRQAGVPRTLHDGLIEYFAARRPTGSFLRACLENDFREACLRADPINRFELVWIGLFLHHYTPASAWGSPAAVEAWLADPAAVPQVFE